MGALDAVKVVELSALGPAPFGAMLLADMGADVVRVDRVGEQGYAAAMVGLARNRRSIAVDLKSDAGVDVVRRLVARADVFIEGFRPGVAERLGLGPDPLCTDNRRLVYARASGWGHDGPLAPAAGHDINFLALAGGLHPMGPAGAPPVPPLNYVADFAGGGCLLAVGILAALAERSTSGRGQVVDAAMVDGAALMTGFVRGLYAAGGWSNERGGNILDGSAPFYRAYECADGRYVAVGAIEPKFYESLCATLNLDVVRLPQFDREVWPDAHAAFEAEFASKERDEWVATFEGVDACVTPVLDLEESAMHPHLVDRGTFLDVDGMVQPSPAPRLSRTPSNVRAGVCSIGEHTEAILSELGLDRAQRMQMRASGTVG